MPLLQIENLTLDFVSDGQSIRTLDGLSFNIDSGEIVCLAGESGSGKSITALSVARLVPSPPADYVAGRILLEGNDVLQMNKKALRSIRGGMVSYIFQEPAASLNPVMRVGDQIMEMLALHRPEAASKDEVVRLLQVVGIPGAENRMPDYPHQFSGGMQQRVMIAMAVAAHPKLLIADEPTTALDVTIQEQIMDLLRELKEQLGMSILLITHNLALVKNFADRVLVMYAGQIVEEADRTDLFADPKHPYTRALLHSVPQLGARRTRLLSIPGNVPQPGTWPSGCRFHPRCPQRQESCDQELPPLLEPKADQRVRCPFWELKTM